MMNGDRDELLRVLAEAISNGRLINAVLSGPDAKLAGDTIRIDVRPVAVSGQSRLQFSSRTATQTLHANRDADAAIEQLDSQIGRVFRNFRATTTTHELEARLSKRGKCFVTVRPVVLSQSDNDSSSATTSNAHNRRRSYLIPDGVPCPFLIKTGVMLPDGRVRSEQMKKFRQINRYLEFIRDVLPALPDDRPLRIVDFGCGKSYLTFAVHHYLTQLQRESTIVGLDRRADVVTTCQGIVESLRLSNLTFAVGAIDQFESPEPVDLVISLHACDTATDHALSQAAVWNAAVVLAVPCCHKELLPHLAASSMAPLTSFGITRERTASLLTDSIRASLMSAAGYEATVMEFIETEHTPKNLLIRCVRPANATAASRTRSGGLADVRRLSSQLQLPSLTLERQLLGAGLIVEPDCVAPRDFNDVGCGDQSLVERIPTECPAC